MFCNSFWSLRLVILGYYAYVKFVLDSSGTYGQPTVIVGDYSSYQTKEQYDSIIVYTDDTCPVCANLKQYLKEEKLTYIERDIHDKNYLEDLKDMGVDNVPTILYKNKMIIGYTPTDFSRYLDDI